MKMELCEVENRPNESIRNLAKVRETSVRATHHFLREEEIVRLREFVPAAVDVNGQNPQTRGFCEHLGFRVTGRSELDGQGAPYPILHMQKCRAPLAGVNFTQSRRGRREECNCGY